MKYIPIFSYIHAVYGICCTKYRIFFLITFVNFQIEPRTEYVDDDPALAQHLRDLETSGK